MKKIRLLSTILLAALLTGLCMPAAMAVDEPQADSSHAIVLLAEKGSDETVLYTRNENEQMFPASLTKVMTVLLAVEAVENGSVKLSDMVTAQPGFDFDMEVGGTSVDMTVGETMTLENLLYCAMVASANEACNVIAEYIGGSVGDFVDMMNARAAELGCANTHFANTHGLQNPSHYTTAWDFSRILREAASHELFMEICDTVNYTVPGTNNSGERHLESTNSLINPTNPQYPGDYGYDYARGVKTGHTSDAGYCLATTAEKDGVKLLCVVMKAEAYKLEDGSMYYGHFADARTLFEWAYENFSYQEIVRSTEMVAEIPVEMGADAEVVSIRPSSSITAFLPNDVDLEGFERSITVATEYGDGKTLQAPVSAGQVVGEITVSLNGTVYGRAALVTSTSVGLSRVQFMKGELAETLRRPAVVITFWVLLLLFFTYLTLVVRYRMKRRAYQRRLENARQIRLDLEDEEEERRAERRARRAAEKAEMVLTPESVREAPEAVPAIDEPTKYNSGELTPAMDTQPTRADLPRIDEGNEEQVRDYFEEFFGNK